MRARTKRVTALHSLDIAERVWKITPEPAVTARRQPCQLCSLHHQCVLRSVCSENLAAMNAITIQRKPLQKGQHIYRQQDPFKSVYVVRSGAIKTLCLDKRGREHLTGYYLPGELFGIDGIVDHKHLYSAQTLETVSICEIPYQDLEKDFTAHPALQRRIMTIMCAELFHRQQSMLASRQVTAEERLASFLTDISARMATRGLSATKFCLPMTRRDIAGYLGLTVETISRLLSRLQCKSVIIVKGRSITIIDLDRLKAMSTFS